MDLSAAELLLRRVDEPATAMGLPSARLNDCMPRSPSLSFSAIFQPGGPEDDRPGPPKARRLPNRP
jgi:hypothetical protein